MFRAICLTALAAAATPAQAGDTEAGQDLARAVCAECHWVERWEPGGLSAAAPAFRDIATASDHSEISLRAFFRTPHAEMPNFMLTPEQTADLVAYILSLKQP